MGFNDCNQLSFIIKRLLSALIVSHFSETTGTDRCITASCPQQFCSNMTTKKQKTKVQKRISWFQVDGKQVFFEQEGCKSSQISLEITGMEQSPLINTLFITWCGQLDSFLRRVGHPGPIWTHGRDIHVHYNSKTNQDNRCLCVRWKERDITCKIRPFLKSSEQGSYQQKYCVKLGL